MERDRTGPTAEDWMAEAEEDLAAARTLMASAHYSRAIFHAQQCVEKGLKAAYVALQGNVPPRIHRLRPLAYMAFGDSADEVRLALEELEKHYTTSRYPVEVGMRPSDNYTQEDAEEAVTQCSELLTWIRSRLPESGS